MLNKKGQGMSTNTIILLILGLAVLIVLILGFTMGWSKLAPFLSSSNVDTIATACETSCSLGSTYDYCTAPRVLKDVEGNEIKASCAVLAGESSLNQYGIKSCSMNCKKPCGEVKINDVAGGLLPTSPQTDVMFDVSFLATDIDADANLGCYIAK